MKDIFERLFGKKAAAEGAEKRPAAAEPRSSEESFQPYQSGDVIAGKYEVRRVLGRGGFGIVYLVRFRETGEDFALKTFKDELTTNPAALEAFKKEALVWVNLERHPFILPAIWVEEIRHGRIATADGSGKLVLDARSSQEVCGRLLVIMDCVEADAHGRATLRDHLAGTPLDEEQVLKWGIQFCLGMEHAKAHGVECHRDIKPANIMITQDGTLKVSDFGLAIPTESAWNGSAVISAIQAEGKVIRGTPGYIAPEVCRAEGASVRSDIYSFGLVLWQMVAGSPIPPFRVPNGGDTVDYMRAVYEQQVSGRIPRLDGPLGGVIERCLRAEPSERYGTFQELRAVLEPILERKTGRKFEMPQSTGKTAAFWNNKGGALAALGRHEEGIRCYDTALEIELQTPKIWNNKGSALSALGRRREALECFDRALAIDPRFAMACENKGRELHILGRLEEALHCLEKALSLDSRDAGAWLKKGAVLAAMGKQVEAIACYDQALVITPRSLESLYNKGLSLMRLGKNTEAWTCFDQVVAIDPGFEMAWINKGNLLATSGRHEDAVSCFDQVIAINSANADAHNNKATSLAALGRREEALSSCDRALKADPRHASAWAGKGAVLAAAGKVADAVACYDKALALDAKNVIAWCGKGSSLAASGNHSQALVCFERVLALEPKNAAVLFGKAISEEMEGRLSDAAKTLGRFIEVAGPTYAEEVAAAKRHLKELVRYEASPDAGKFFARGYEFQLAGNNAEAIRCYEAGLAIDGSNTEIWINKGAAFQVLNRNSDAFTCLDRAISISPGNVMAWNNKGHLLLRLDRLDEALSAFDHALGLNPHHANAWFGKGQVLAKLDKHEEALACYENVVRLDPMHDQAWYAMGRSMGFLGRHEDVIKCCDRALQINPHDSSIWLLKGLGSSAMKRYLEAISSFQQAEKLGDAKAAGLIANCRMQEAKRLRA